MTRRGSAFIVAIAAAMGIAIAAVIAGCGVKAPPRPPLREVPPARASETAPPAAAAPGQESGPARAPAAPPAAPVQPPPTAGSR